MSLARATAGLLLLAAAGCGITPTGVVDVAGPPVVRIPPPSKTIYLLRETRLVKQAVNVENDTVDSLLTALFQANNRELFGLQTALRGFAYEGVQDSLDSVPRDEVRLPRTSKLTVYVMGEGRLSRLGKAQIVCTAQQDAAFKQVKIIRQFSHRAPREEGAYTCENLNPVRE
ncbi:hypothetical protein [Nonomuraea longicatena]|uniref:GerMN domain-containing protein n=1 Tax=Nonomuraea longicatena TaxID=83682 RepID=A0ABN1QYJ2_9ACTN